MKIDLHCHSKASWDCVSEFSDIIQRCKAKGIRYQAITDHNEIWGAQRLQEMTLDDAELTVLIGEEIYSKAGEIIGLFLKESIPPGLSALETVRCIKAQNGLVLLPHPFDKLKRSRLGDRAREQITEYVDIVETFNAHISQQRFNHQAQVWADTHNKLKSAGSDGHTLKHIGSAYTDVPQGNISTPRELLEALRQGVIHGQWRHPASTLIGRLLSYGNEKLRQ